jgi:uncharacterized protein
MIQSDRIYLPHSANPRGRTLFDMAGLLMDLRDLLELKVDVVTEPGLKPRIRDRVPKEAEL